MGEGNEGDLRGPRGPGKSEVGSGPRGVTEEREGGGLRTQSPESGGTEGPVRESRRVRQDE